jgi:triosephosphate isomerase (TIM)
MSKPLVVINFKAYEQSFGASALQLAKTIEEVARIKGIPVIICVPATELRAIAAAVKIPVYAQHADPIGVGAHTGWLPPQVLLAAGAKGTLINHSEHRLNKDVERAVTAAKQAGLKVILCVQDALEAKVLRNLGADYIAVEPPELIGGDVAISQARPELISQSVKHCPDNLLVGAGVKKRDDIVKSLELGAKGVLLASGVVKAANPKEVLLELCTGW